MLHSTKAVAIIKTILHRCAMPPCCTSGATAAAELTAPLAVTAPLLGLAPLLAKLPELPSVWPRSVSFTPTVAPESGSGKAGGPAATCHRLCCDLALALLDSDPRPPWTQLSRSRGLDSLNAPILHAWLMILFVWGLAGEALEKQARCLCSRAPWWALQCMDLSR
jgi:hypothetical protein